MKPKVFCEDECPVKDVPVGRQAIVSTLGWAPALEQAVWGSGKVVWQPHSGAEGVTGGLVLEGTGDESLFPVCLLETHHGFRVIVLLFCLDFGIVEGDGVRGIRQQHLL